MVTNIYYILISRVLKTRFWDYKSSLWGSVCMIWCGLIATWHSHGNWVSKTRFPRVYDVAIRCQRIQVEAPRNRVLETRFPIGLFQILKSVSNVSLSLSLTLTPTHTPTPTPSHSQTKALSLSDETDPLSPCQPHPHRRRSSSHSLSPIDAAVARPLTLSALHPHPLTLTQARALVPCEPHPRRRSSSHSLSLTNALKSFSLCLEVLEVLQSLKTKKKRWVPCESLFFCFCFEFPIELLKKIEALLFFEFRLCF